MATLTCLPQSPCSSDFRILGVSSGEADVTYNFFSSQGTIFLDGIDYAVRKQSLLFGKWTLERNAHVFARAEKPTLALRSFTVQWEDSCLIAKRRTLFTRSYDLVSGDSVIGAIQPFHPFTRRATIECDPAIPDLIQLFAFWLTALIWRQEARRSS